MPFGNYSELALALTRWIDRTDRASEIADYVTLVEKDAGRRLGLRDQDKVTTGTLLAGAEYLETPPGILYPRQLVFTTDPPVAVEIVSLVRLEEVRVNGAGQAAPVYAAVDGTNPATFATRIRVAPLPTAASTPYRLYYTDAIVPLTAAANYLLTVAPDLYLYGCLDQNARFDRQIAPDGTTQWTELYLREVESVRKLEWRARAKAGTLKARPRHWVYGIPLILSAANFLV